MTSDVSTVPIRLPNGVVMQAEISSKGGSREGDVASSLGSAAVRSLDDVMAAIEGIASSVEEAFQKVQPDEATIEFGLELAAESGKLTALLVKGGGKASLTITLKWTAGGPPSKSDVP